MCYVTQHMLLTAAQQDRKLLQEATLLKLLLKQNS
jgi:hypothetical protein